MPSSAAGPPQISSAVNFIPIDYDNPGPILMAIINPGNPNILGGNIGIALASSMDIVTGRDNFSILANMIAIANQTTITFLSRLALETINKPIKAIGHIAKAYLSSNIISQKCIWPLNFYILMPPKCICKEDVIILKILFYSSGSYILSPLAGPEGKCLRMALINKALDDNPINTVYALPYGTYREDMSIL